MYSKNNHDRHPLEREYFDRPVNYIHKGFLFSPKFKLPLDLGDNKDSHYNLNNSPTRTGYASNFYRSSSIQAQASQLTTGMPDCLLYDSSSAQPKQLNKVAGKISNDYGIIPSLRTPIKLKRNYTK